LKVLWFTNAMLPRVCEHFKLPESRGGGWMETLRSNLEVYFPDLLLHIACFVSDRFVPFTINNTTYYPLIKDKEAGKVKGILRRWKHIKYSDYELNQIRDLVIQCSPDLVHVHGSENIFGLVQEAVNIPVVISLQGIIMSCQNYQFPGIGILDRFRIEHWLEFLKGRGLTHQALIEKNYVSTEKQILTKCRYFFGRTDWDKSLAMLFNPNAKYYYVAEILREPFYQVAWECSSLDECTVFATLSSSIRKGTLILLDSIGILKRNGYEGIRVVLAGVSKKEKIWPLIKEKIIENNIFDNVVCKGNMDAKQIADALSNSSVFVHPSFIDNSPNSLAEAMMVGTPCVATSVGGVQSMLEHKKEGILCTPGDPYSLAASINQVFINKEETIKFSINARKRARQVHNKIEICRQIEDAYRTIVLNEE